DEVGLTGGADPACRKCMVWDDRQDKNLLAFVKKLIGIRKQHAELLSAGEIKWQVDDRTGLLVLQRKFEEESLVGIFNLGNENLTFDMSLATLLMNLTRFDKDLYQIAPQGFMIYQKKSSKYKKTSLTCLCCFLLKRINNHSYTM